MRKFPLIVTSALFASAFVTAAWAQTTAAPAPAAKPAAAPAQERKDPRDTDGDHRASWDEYRKAMSDNFVRLDKNKDNVLESAELPQNPPPKPGQRLSREQFDKDLRTGFDNLDKNKDGYLAGDELPRAPGAKPAAAPTAAKK